jgi:tripartite-type tricarboxylate transporter receptor subunit TctC
MPILSTRLLSSLALALGLFTAVAAADEYPSKAVRLIVPFPPAGSNDIVGRMIGAQLGERLGKQVIIDNRAGAGGTLGTEIARSRRPTGTRC